MTGQIYRLGAVATVLLTVLSLSVPAVRAAATGAWYAEYYANRDRAGGPLHPPRHPPLPAPTGARVSEILPIRVSLGTWWFRV